MEKSQAVEMISNSSFIRSINPIPLSFTPNSDGFEILVCNLSYRISTKRENGLL
jgi:hypothetical protein